MPVVLSRSIAPACGPGMPILVAIVANRSKANAQYKTAIRTDQRLTVL